MIPILFENDYLSLQTRWVLIVVGLIVGGRLAVRELKRNRVNFSLFIEHSGRYLLTALFFSRLFFFLMHPDMYFPRLDLRTFLNFFTIWDQGLSFWGAFFGFFLVLTFTARKAKENLLKWCDALCFPMMVGLIFGFLGAFAGGYAYGIPTNLPWGVQYEVANVKYAVPIHPTQIYMIVGFMLLLFFQRWNSKHTDFFKKAGVMTGYYGTGVSGLYFLVDFLRGDDTLLLFGIRGTLFLWASIFIFSLIFLYKHSNSPISHDEPL